MLMFLTFFHTSSVGVWLVMVDVYVFHDRLLLCLISEFGAQFLEVIKFPVVRCFLALLKAWWLSFAQLSILRFTRGWDVFFLLSLLFLVGGDASYAALMIDSSVSIALFRLMLCLGRCCVAGDFEGVHLFFILLYLNPSIFLRFHLVVGWIWVGEEWIVYYYWEVVTDV